MKGFQIKALRNALGLTQEKFAQRLGVSFSTVNRWENGKEPSPLAISQIERIAEDAGINPAAYRRMRASWKIRK